MTSYTKLAEDIRKELRDIRQNRTQACRSLLQQALAAVEDAAAIRKKALEDAARFAFKTCWELGNSCNAGSASVYIPDGIRKLDAELEKGK